MEHIEVIIRVALPLFMLGLLVLAWTVLRRGFLTPQTPSGKIICRSYYNPRLEADLKYVSTSKASEPYSLCTFDGKNLVVWSDQKTSDLTRTIKCVGFFNRKGKA